MASLLLGAILVFSILSIHTVLLKERQRIENIEQQILTQQQQWSEIWVKTREEDQAKAAARAAEADTNAQMIIEKVQEIAEAAPVDEAPAGSQAPISDEVVEDILKDSLAVPPEAGQAPDYHDERIVGQMDIEAPKEPDLVEEKESVPEPDAPEHDPAVEHKKVARKFMPREQRFPKLLIMGVKQCGTIALGRYLKIHPDLVNAGETFFFAKTFSKGLEYYRSLMPNSTEDQIVFERTSNYYRLPVVPDRVRNFNRTMKMIMVTCDPVRRSLSDFAHLHRNDDPPIEKGAFEEKLEPTLTRMEAELAEIKTEEPELWFDKVYRMYKDRTNWFNYTDTYSNLIINGAYSLYYRRWMENFDSSQLLIIDGTDMIKQPWVSAQKAQEFVGVREVVTEQNFIFNEETGYYCYMPPNDSTKYCLTETTPAAKTMSQEFRDRLHAFYQSFTEVFQGQLARETPFDWNWSPAA